MDDVYDARLAALEQTWQVWAELGAGLSEDQWTTATRCTGWDVAALYAHHSSSPLGMSAPLTLVDDPAGEPLTAANILRGFNAPDGIAHTAAATLEDQAVADAAQHTRKELVDRFSVHGPLALQQLRQLDPSLNATWPISGAVRVGEALRIVLMEATVHLLDAMRALDHPPLVPPAALKDTAQLLAEVAPAVELIEAATGRSTQSPLPVLR